MRLAGAECITIISALSHAKQDDFFLQSGGLNYIIHLAYIFFIQSEAECKPKIQFIQMNSWRVIHLVV